MKFILELEIQFAYEFHSKPVQELFPIVVETQLILNTTTSIKNLESQSRFSFYYIGAYNQTISSLRVNVPNANNYKYFIFTFLQIR